MVWLRRSLSQWHEVRASRAKVTRCVERAVGGNVQGRAVGAPLRSQTGDRRHGFPRAREWRRRGNDGRRLPRSGFAPAARLSRLSAAATSRAAHASARCIVPGAACVPFIGWGPGCATGLTSIARLGLAFGAVPARVARSGAVAVSGVGSIAALIAGRTARASRRRSRVPGLVASALRAAQAPLAIAVGVLRGSARSVHSGIGAYVRVGA
jgi:hypothetical protein